VHCYGKFKPFKGKSKHFIFVIFSLLQSNLSCRGGFVEHLSMTYVAQQSVTKIIIVTIMNLVAPKAGARHELLFNEPASDN
jgi:hypothetical protein